MIKTITIERLKFYLWTAVAFVLLYSFAESVRYPETAVSRAINTTILVSFLTFVNLLFFEGTIPLLKQGFPFLFRGLLWLLGTLVLYSIGLYYWREGWIRLSIYTSYHSESSTWKGILVHSQFSFATLLFFGTVRHFYNYIQLKKDTRQLRIEKQDAELNFLKSQTNPHFLFNTLNNIYSLAQDKSDLAPQSILRLSKILRFMLYETSGKFIRISQEVSIIENYIALEQLRYDDSLKINFDKQIDNDEEMLPPLLLIPLIENAFKHGVAESSDEAFVKINLVVENKKLKLVVHNSMDRNGGDIKLQEGIGLSNLRRQLVLLYSDYELSVRQADGQFIAALNINLRSHA